MAQTHFSTQDIEQKLENLRTLWIENPLKHSIIERQAKLLKTALSIKLKKQPEQQPIAL